MKVRVVERKSSQIKELINETSKKFKNFSDFHIKPHNILADIYEIYLCFDEKRSLNNDKIMQIELINNIPYVDMSKFIEQINDDFDNLIGIDIIPNKEKQYLALVILKFEVSRNIDKIRTTDIYHISWSGTSDLYGVEIGMDIARYTCGNPNPLGDGVFRENLLITSIKNGILIRLRYSKKEYDELLKILWDDEIKSYKIIEYGIEDSSNWSRNRIIINEESTKYLDTNSISKIIAQKVEKELGIQVSNRSIKAIQQDIEEICKYKKDTTFNKIV